MEKMWIFTDVTVGDEVIFDSYEKAKKFLKQYNDWIFEHYGEFLQEGEDYRLEEAALNLNFKDWWGGEEVEAK